MELALNLGAFEALDNNDLLAVDGGASKFAVAVVNIGCGVIGGAIGAGVGALAGAAVGGFWGGAVGGVVGLVGGAVGGYYLADSITSNW